MIKIYLIVVSVTNILVDVLDLPLCLGIGSILVIIFTN